jgi:hypothetical protein
MLPLPPSLLGVGSHPLPSLFLSNGSLQTRADALDAYLHEVRRAYELARHERVHCGSSIPQRKP